MSCTLIAIIVVRSSDTGPRVVVVDHEGEWYHSESTVKQPICTLVAAFREKRHRLVEHFSQIVLTTRSHIKKLNIRIKDLVHILTQSHGAHKSFPTEKQRQLCKVQNYDQFFLLLEKYCNFLAYDLLDKLILQLSYRFYSFHGIRTQLQAYKKEVRLFKKSTTLKIFCDGHTNDRTVPLRIAKKVSAYNWPNRITLENVEVFRQSHPFQSLERCAIIVFQVLQSR